MTENKHSAYDLAQMQSLPLSAKVIMTKQRIKAWYEYFDSQVYVSFSGGKDSTVLKHIIDSMYDDVPALFVNTGLEYPELQRFVTDIKNGKYECFNSDIQIVRPEKRFDEVIKECGYPIISKEISHKMKDYQSAKRKGNHSYVEEQLNGTYITKNGKTNMMSIQKWKPLTEAPFPISHRCCDIMKKHPSKKYEKETGRKAFIGTMADESILRKQKWMQNGCNAFETNRPTSQPLSFWTSNDVLEYIRTYDVPYALVYGDIIETDSGLKTTGCDRTGCMFCMFGCHLEKAGEGRFEKMKETHPKQYDYCMNQLGLKEVIDWTNEHCGCNIKY